MLTPRRLIISDGSPPALAALALQDRPDQAILWVPTIARPAAPRCLTVIARQAAHFRIDRTMGPGASPSEQPAVRGNHDLTALEEAQVLIDAIITAVELQCSRVVWPCQAGLDLERMAKLHEVVMCAAHLASLDATSKNLAPDIRTPVLDCTDEQVVDLIVSSGASTSLAWRCDHDAPQPCGGCNSCRRWDAVLRATAAA
jgi:hypothetical protein